MIKYFIIDLLQTSLFRLKLMIGSKFISLTFQPKYDTFVMSIFSDLFLMIFFGYLVVIIGLVLTFETLGIISRVSRLVF